MSQHCPHCGIGQISLAKKLLFGPLFRFQCGHCGQRWRVSHWSVVVAVLAIIGTPVLAVLSWSLGLLRPGALSLLAIAFVNFALAILAVAFWVPVRAVVSGTSQIPSGPTGGRMVAARPPRRSTAALNHIPLKKSS